VKNKYQLLFYVVIFFAGYCTNFFLPVNSVGVESSQGVSVKNVESLNKNLQFNKDNCGGIANTKVIPEAKLQIVSLQASHSSVANDSQSSVRSADITALQSELAKLRDYRMQTEVNKHNEYLQLHGGNSVEALNDNFTREPVDANWAKEKQTLIDNLLDQSEHLSRLPHMESECRSKQCKLSVLSDDVFYLKELSGSLDKVIADHGSSFSSYTTVIDEKSHTTSIYLDRN